MSRYFQNLVERSLAGSQAIRPRSPSFFESTSQWSFPAALDSKVGADENPENKNAADAGGGADPEKVGRDDRRPRRLQPRNRDTRDGLREKVIFSRYEEENSSVAQDDRKTDQGLDQDIRENAHGEPRGIASDPDLKDKSGGRQSTLRATEERSEEAPPVHRPDEKSESVAAERRREAEATPTKVLKQEMRTIFAPLTGRKTAPPPSLLSVPQKTTPENTVRVTIGRIEVRASLPQVPPVEKKERAPKISLEEYLKKQRGGGR